MQLLSLSSSYDWSSSARLLGQYGYRFFGHMNLIRRVKHFHRKCLYTNLYTHIIRMTCPVDSSTGQTNSFLHVPESDHVVVCRQPKGMHADLFCAEICECCNLHLTAQSGRCVHLSIGPIYVPKADCACLRIQLA